MIFPSAQNEILQALANLDIVIEPEESAVRSAVNKLKQMDQHYFDGVQKIVVEQGNAHSPYLGKSTSDKIIYLSLDTIKEALKQKGYTPDNAEALANEIIETLGHEKTHIKENMKPSEVGPETEEKRLSQVFPSPKIDVEKTAGSWKPPVKEKEAPKVVETEENKQIHESLRQHVSTVQRLNNEIKRLNEQIQMLDWDLSKRELPPDARTALESKRTSLDSQLKSKQLEVESVSTEIAQLKDKLAPAKKVEVAPIPAAETAPVAPQVPAPITEKPVENREEVEKFENLFKLLEPKVTDLLHSGKELAAKLNSAPKSVRGEHKVSKTLESRLGAVNNTFNVLKSAMSNKSNPKKFLYEITEQIFALADYVGSDEFSGPLTNQAGEEEFFNSSIAPLKTQLLFKINALVKDLFDLRKQHNIISPAEEVAPTIKAPEGSRGKIIAPDNINDLQLKLKQQLEDLNSKLFSAQKIISEFPQQPKDVDNLDGSLVAEISKVKSKLDSETNTDKKNEFKSALDRLLAARARRLSSNSELNDKLSAVIAPFISTDQLEKRIKSTKEKLDLILRLKDLQVRKVNVVKLLANISESGNPPTPEDMSAISDALGDSKTIEKLDEEIREIHAALMGGARISDDSVTPEGKVDEKLDERAEKASKSLQLSFSKNLFKSVLPDILKGKFINSKIDSLKDKLSEYEKNLQQQTIYETPGQPRSVKITDAPAPESQSFLEQQAIVLGKQVAQLRDVLQRQRSPEMSDFAEKLAKGFDLVLAGQSVAGMDFVGDKLRIGNRTGDQANKFIATSLNSLYQPIKNQLDSLVSEFKDIDEKIRILDDEGIALTSDGQKYQPNDEQKKALLLQWKAQKRARLASLNEQLTPGEKKDTIKLRIIDFFQRMMIEAHPIEEEAEPDIHSVLRKKEDRPEALPAPEMPAEERTVLTEKILDLRNKRKAIQDQIEKLKADFDSQPKTEQSVAAHKSEISKLVTDDKKLQEALRALLFKRKQPTQEFLDSAKDLSSQVGPDAATYLNEYDSSGNIVGKDVFDPEYNTQHWNWGITPEPEFDTPGYSAPGKLPVAPEKAIGINPEQKKRLITHLQNIRDERKTLEARIDGLNQQIDQARANKDLVNIKHLESLRDKLVARAKELDDQVGKIRKVLNQLDIIPKGQNNLTDTVVRNPTRMYTPSDEDKENARRHRERFEEAQQSGKELKDIRKQKGRQKAQLHELRQQQLLERTERKGFPKADSKAIAHSRALQWAGSQALQMNPYIDHEGILKNNLNQVSSLENAMRKLKSDFENKATEAINAAKAQNPNLSDKQASDIKQAEMLKGFQSAEYSQLANDYRIASRALEDAIKVPGSTEWADPYMYFFKLVYEYNEKLLRYKAAKKVANSAARKVLHRSMKLVDADPTMVEAFNEGDALEKLSKEIAANVRDQSAKKHTKDEHIFFDPNKVREYLEELADAQAKVVRENELLRRYVQVATARNLSSNVKDPDKMAKKPFAEKQMGDRWGPERGAPKVPDLGEGKATQETSRRLEPMIAPDAKRRGR